MIILNALFLIFALPCMLFVAFVTVCYGVYVYRLYREAQDV